MNHDQDLCHDQSPGHNQDPSRRQNPNLNLDPDLPHGYGRNHLPDPGLEAVAVTIGRTVFSPARMIEKGDVNGINGNPVWMMKMLRRRKSHHRLSLYHSTFRDGLRREKTEKTREGPVTGPTGRAGITITIALIAAVVVTVAAVMAKPVTVTGRPSHWMRMEMSGRKPLLLVIWLLGLALVIDQVRSVIVVARMGKRADIAIEIEAAIEIKLGIRTGTGSEYAIARETIENEIESGTETETVIETVIVRRPGIQNVIETVRLKIGSDLVEIGLPLLLGVIPPGIARVG